MARYIVVRVEDNDTADRLLERLKVVPAIRLIGLFPTPTKFCEGKSICGDKRTLIRSTKTGILHCSNCRKPVNTVNQSPKNLLLADPDLPTKFVDFRISVREPYDEPEKVYGTKTIELKKQALRDTEATLKKRRQRTSRRTQRRRSVR